MEAGHSWFRSNCNHFFVVGSASISIKKIACQECMRWGACKKTRHAACFALPRTSLAATPAARARRHRGPQRIFCITGGPRCLQRLAHMAKQLQFSSCSSSTSTMTTACTCLRKMACGLQTFHQAVRANPLGLRRLAPPTGPFLWTRLPSQVHRRPLTLASAGSRVPPSQTFSRWSTYVGVACCAKNEVQQGTSTFLQFES